MDQVAFNAYLALVALRDGHPEDAKGYLVRVPRAERGELKIALDNLDMMLSRLGRG